MRSRFLAAIALVIAVALATSPTTGHAEPTPRATPASTPRLGYFSLDALTAEQRAVLARVGVEPSQSGTRTFFTASSGQAQQMRDAGLALKPEPHPVDAVNAAIAARPAAASAQANGVEFPRGFEAYHTYEETAAELRRIQSAYPQLAKLVTLGKSYEGRQIYALKISSDAQKPSKKPESLQTCNVHAREHLTTEMCLYLANEMTSKYASDQRIKKILDTIVIWIVPMQNPDGSTFDISGGKFQSWRKNRQPSGGSIGIDLNRNYDFGWGGPGASTDPDSETYRGTRAEEGVEVKVITNFIRSRKSQLKTYVDFHTFSELIMWPYGNTYSQVMGNPEYKVLTTLGRSMANSNRYTAQKSSALYLASGVSADWAFGKARVWSYVFEMYPGSNGASGFYPPASVISQETARNREAMLMLYENTDCMWKVIGEQSRCTKKRA